MANEEWNLSLQMTNASMDCNTSLGFSSICLLTSRRNLLLARNLQLFNAPGILCDIFT